MTRVLADGWAVGLVVVRRDARTSSIVAVDDDTRLRRLVELGDLPGLLAGGYFAGSM